MSTDEAAVPASGERASAAAVAVVTGAGSGIGRAIAETLAARGDAVVLVDRDPGPTLAELSGAGVRCAAVTGDVADPATHAAAVEAARGLGTLLGWVNCAGVDLPGDLVTLTPAEAAATVDTNLYGTLWGTQAALAAWTSGGAAAPAGAAIVSISSVHGRRAFPGHGVYEMTKAAIEALMRNVAVTYAAQGIRANVVAPGGVLTPGLQSSLDSALDPAAALAELTSFIPAGRLASPAEVAAAVAYLLSPAASYVTGHTLLVDGAMTAHLGFVEDPSARRPA